MRKNTLASTASSLALVAFSASALLLAPTAARAAAVTIGDSTTHAYVTGTDTTVTFNGTAGNATGILTTTTGDNFGANAISTTNAAVGAGGTGTVTATVGAGTIATASIGSSTNFINTVGITGATAGTSTVTTTGNVGASNLNVTTATQTISGTSNVNSETLTGASVTHSGTAALGTVAAGTTSALTLAGAGNTVTTLGLTGTATANLNGTSTVTTLNAASGTTTNVNAASTIGTLNAAAGSTTNVGAATTVTTLGTGTGAISVTGTNTLTLTNGATATTGAHGLTFATSNHTGAGGTVSNITSASANGLNLSGAAVTFNATNTGAATDRTHYIVATDNAGVVTGPTAGLTTTNGVAGYTYGVRTDAAQHNVFVIQTLNSNYTSTATDGTGAANRAAISNYLQGTLVGSNQDVTGTGLNAYLNNLNAVRVSAGANSAALGHVIDQAAAQSTVQVSNNFATGLMNVVSDRTGVMQGTHTASNGSDGISAGDASTGKAVWVEAFGSLGREDTRGGAAGFDASNAGFAVGAEKKLSAASAVGISASYGAGRYESNEAGAPKLTTSNDYQASIYGSSYVAPNWYIDGQIGGGYHQFNEGNAFVGVGSTSGDYHGWGYFGQIGTGYDFRTSTPAMITPFAKLAYQGLDSDSYTESGSAGLARHINSDTAQTLTGFLGAKVAWQGLSAWNTKFTPQVRAAYFHDFEQEGLGTTANFVGTGSATTFSNTGNNLAKDGYTVGLGLTAARANGWNFDVNYDYEGRDGYSGNSGTLQAKYNF